MSFKNIRGQDNAISFLKGSLRTGRIAHAYIFLGPGGVGKRLAAMNFAKALNCDAPSGDGPCDSCIPCRKADALNHPDLFIVAPEKEGSSIKIGRMRELIKDIGLKPYEARKKVYIIDHADSMTQESSNALLKTLEEPPTDSIIILIAENMGTLFETIVSRSQVVRFSPLNTEEVKAILIKEYGVDGLRAHIVAHLSSGRLGEALRLKEAEFFDKRSAWIDALAKGRLFEYEDIPKEDLASYLDIALSWYRDMLVGKSGVEAAMLINIDRHDAIIRASKRLDAEYLNRMIVAILRTNAYLERNANPKLAMSVLALGLDAE